MEKEVVITLLFAIAALAAIVSMTLSSLPAGALSPGFVAAVKDKSKDVGLAFFVNPSGPVHDDTSVILSATVDKKVENVAFVAQLSGCSQKIAILTNEPFTVSWVPASSGCGFGTYVLSATATHASGKQEVKTAAISVEQQNVPPQPVCGNNIIEATEQCDAGNANGQACTAAYGSSCQYCSASCTSVTVNGGYCGNGAIEGPEACDNGASNDNACTAGYGGTCSYCTSACALSIVVGPHCGDATCDNAETCTSCSADCGACPVPPVTSTNPAYNFATSANTYPPGPGTFAQQTFAQLTPPAGQGTWLFKVALSGQKVSGGTFNLDYRVYDPATTIVLGSSSIVNPTNATDSTLQFSIPATTQPGTVQFQFKSSQQFSSVKLIGYDVSIELLR